MAGTLASILSQSKNPTTTSRKYFINEIQDDNGLSGNTFINAAAVDKDGNVYTVGGYLNTSFGSYASLTKFDKNGTFIWKRSLADLNIASAQSTASCYMAKIDPHNLSVCIGINFTNTSGGQQILFARYTLEGVLVFQRSLTPPVGITAANHRDLLDSLTVTSDGSYYGFGYTTLIDGTQNAMLTKGAISNGAVTTIRSFADGSGASASEFFDGECDSDGNVYAIGIAKGTGLGQVGLIVKYNSAGTFQWSYNIFDSFNDILYAIVEAHGITIKNNILYISGTFSNTLVNQLSQRKMFVLKMDLDGNLLSYKTFKKNLYYNVGASSSLSIDQGSIYPFGSVLDSKGNLNILCSDGIGTVIVKLDNNLNIVNSLFLDLYGSAIAIDSNDDIFICGGITSTSGTNGFVFKYEGSRFRPTRYTTLSDAMDVVFRSDNIVETNDIITISTGVGTSSTPSHSNAAGTLTAGTAPALGIFTNTEYK